MPSTLSLVSFACVLVYSVQSQEQLKALCPAPRSNPLTFSLVSRRNATGHWLSEYDFQHSGQRTSPSDVKSVPPWRIEAQQSTVACGGIESALHFKISVTTPPPLAGPGYEFFPGLGYYKFHPVLTTWDPARKICADEGAHIIIINSEAESELVKKLYARHPSITNRWAWVGVRERTKDAYFTIFGDRFEDTGFTRMLSSQPNNNGPDDCLVIEKTTGSLEDVSCLNEFAVICEQEMF